MPHDILAVDLALLLPDDLNAKAVEINHTLWEQSHRGFLFDETHLPHITLVQQFIERERLSDIRPALSMVLQTMSSPLLRIVDYEKYRLPDGLPIHGWGFVPSPELRALHQKCFQALEPFAQIAGASDHYLRNPGDSIREGSIEYTRHFRDQKSGKNFAPHVTLGVGDQPQAMSFPIDFKATTVALCHLGNFNTCRNILASWTLG